MKRIKRLLILILLVVSIFVLVSCDDKPQAVQLTDLTLPKLGRNEMAVIIKNGDNDYTSYTVSLGKVGSGELTCEQVLVYLNENADLALGWADSGFGKFVNSIGGINSDPSHEYVQVFTSNSNFQGTWAGVETRQAGEVTLASSSVGVTELGVAAGDVVYFELGSF